jgi:endogenous inhibitor of DNA gyrase (YacG/DUF329 family)
MLRCPICRRSAAPRAQNKAFPFCSPRCKQVDLGKWLDQQYGVPVSEADSGVESSRGDAGDEA